jgi:hypothetical protein
MSSQFHPDSAGVGAMLRSDFMQEAMRTHAETIKQRAESIAPVAHTRRKDYHPGRYRASFHVRVQERGGATHDRAEAIVYNDAPEAFYVEYAHYGEEPYHVLARAAFEARGMI